MYIPKQFQVVDEELIFDFIETNGFCILVSNHNGSPTVTHLPLIVDRNAGYLYGHFAKANRQWEDIENQEVLVVFQGPHSYISSSWYETNLSVPTWNYVAVHVYGTVEITEDQKVTLENLNDLVIKYENPNSNYHLDDTNQEFINGLMNGIVAFKLKINKMEGKWKLSQNHSKERQERVIKHLKQMKDENSQDIAYLMEENLKNV
jgi:transcriptional regulator